MGQSNEVDLGTTRKFSCTFDMHGWEEFLDYLESGKFENQATGLRRMIPVARQVQMAQSNGLTVFWAEDPKTGERVNLTLPKLSAPDTRRRHIRKGRS